MKRELNESFEDYKARRANKGKAIAHYLRYGRVLWNRGTYIKAEQEAKAILSQTIFKGE